MDKETIVLSVPIEPADGVDEDTLFKRQKLFRIILQASRKDL